MIEDKNEVEQIYFNWVKESGISNLTGNQVKVIKTLIENRKELINIGGFFGVTKSIIKYLKNNREKIKY